MAQYTYSFLYSEYERIAIELRRDLACLLDGTAADENTKKLVAAVCERICEATDCICEYSKDQLKIW